MIDPKLISYFLILNFLKETRKRLEEVEKIIKAGGN